MSHKPIMVATPDQIRAFAALAIAAGLSFYAEHKMTLNTGYTPQRLMRRAEQITGRKFRARDYTGAALALRQHVGVRP